MNSEERNKRLWHLARKRLSGEMTREDEEEKQRLQDEQDAELPVVESPIEESLIAKLFRHLRRQ